MSDFVETLPQPINYALKAPILVEHIWPSIVSDENKRKNEYICDQRRKSAIDRECINSSNCQQSRNSILQAKDSETQDNAQDDAYDQQDDPYDQQDDVYDELNEYVGLTEK